MKTKTHPFQNQKRKGGAPPTEKTNSKSIRRVQVCHPAPLPPSLCATRPRFHGARRLHLVNPIRDEWFSLLHGDRKSGDARQCTRLPLHHRRQASGYSLIQHGRR
jgi:hypothetical protein